MLVLADLADDLFFGVMAYRTGVVDDDPGFVDLAIEWWEQETGKKPVRR